MRTFVRDPLVICIYGGFITKARAYPREHLGRKTGNAGPVFYWRPR
jgi:hypothetical protein